MVKRNWAFHSGYTSQGAEVDCWKDPTHFKHTTGRWDSGKALPIHPTRSHKKYKGNHSKAELTNRGQLTHRYIKSLFLPKPMAKPPCLQQNPNWHKIFLREIYNARIGQSFASGTSTYFQIIKIIFGKEGDKPIDVQTRWVLWNMQLKTVQLKCLKFCRNSQASHLCYHYKNWSLHTKFILQ